MKKSQKIPKFQKNSKKTEIPKNRNFQLKNTKMQKNPRI